MWEHETLGEFFPGSLPWLHLLLTSAEHQHNLCFHTSMVGIETGLINSKGGRDEKPFPHHFGDLPWLNWRCFLSHALFFCNVFSSKFFLKAKNAMPSMFRSVLPIFFCCCCSLTCHEPTHLHVLVLITFSSYKHPLDSRQDSLSK